MKYPRLLLFLSLGFALPAGIHAQDANFEYLGALVANNEFDVLVGKIRTKAAAGQTTAAALAPEIAELDKAVVTYASDKEAAARFAFLKASLYVEVLGDVAQGKKLFLAVKQDYPDTDSGKNAAKYAEAIDRAAQRDALVPELKPLIEAIAAKAAAGSHSEAAFKDDFAKLDAIAGKHAKHPEVVADVMLKKALIHLQVLGQTAQARELLVAATEKFPTTQSGEIAKGILAQLDGAAPQ